MPRELIRSPFGERLHQARIEAKLTQKQLAAMAGISQSTLAEAERTGQGSSSTAQLAKACKVRAEWLSTGEEPMRALADEFHAVRPEKFNFVVVVGQGAGGTLPERIWSDGDHPVGETGEYAEVVSTDPHAFIIRVVGPSMIPKYTPGDYALVEPGTEPDLEDDVLVRLADGQTLIKRLLSRRGSHIRLGSYNDQEVLVFEKELITWMYYVAYPVPARKIKTRV